MEVIFYLEIKAKVTYFIFDVKISIELFLLFDGKENVS